MNIWHSVLSVLDKWTWDEYYIEFFSKSVVNNSIKSATISVVNTHTLGSSFLSILQFLQGFYAFVCDSRCRQDLHRGMRQASKGLHTEISKFDKSISVQGQKATWWTIPLVSWTTEDRIKTQHSIWYNRWSSKMCGRCPWKISAGSPIDIRCRLDAFLLGVVQEFQRRKRSSRPSLQVINAVVLYIYFSSSFVHICLIYNFPMRLINLFVGFLCSHPLGDVSPTLTFVKKRMKDGKLPEPYKSTSGQKLLEAAITHLDNLQKKKSQLEVAGPSGWCFRSNCCIWLILAQPCTSQKSHWNQICCN